MVFRVSEAARQVGVSISTLRSWERRYGLAPSVRSSGAHRRYSPADIHRLQAVRRLVDRGMPTASAARAVVEEAEEAGGSIAARLRRCHPELSPAALTKPALLAISRAIEDEWAARAGGGLLVGAFQRVRFYEQSRRRWCELARTAGQAVVFADFPSRADPPGEPVRLPLAEDALLRREWVLLCHSRNLGVCLAGWQRPPVAGQVAVYETFWSADPVVVRDALAAAAALAEPDGPDVAAAIRRQLRAASGSADTAASLERITALTNRMVAYLAPTPTS